MVVALDRLTRHFSFAVDSRPDHRAQGLVTCEQAQRTDRGFYRGFENHAVALPTWFGDSQRYAIAVERCGLQRSASVSRSRAESGSSRPSNRAAPLRSPRSLDANASGCPIARAAMRCDVHGPIPGSASSSAHTSSNGATRDRSTAPDATALANVTMVRALAAGIPMPRRSASASASGDGNTCRSPPGRPMPSVSPKRAASRP